MDLPFPGVFQPHICLGLYLKLSHAVQGYNVKLPDRLVVLRRIACCHNDPPLRHFMGSEGFVLQKLEHGRRQCLGHTVDLIHKKDSFFFAGVLHAFVDGCDDLAHGVFGDIHFLAAIISGDDFRQSYRALTGMMGDGIGHEPNLAFLCDLLHNGCFADSRRSHQKDWPLAHQRIDVPTLFVFSQISQKGMLNLIFCFFYIHRFAPN